MPELAGPRGRRASSVCVCTGRMATHRSSACWQVCFAVLLPRAVVRPSFLTQMFDAGGFVGAGGGGTGIGWSTVAVAGVAAASVYDRPAHTVRFLCEVVVVVVDQPRVRVLRVLMTGGGSVKTTPKNIPHVN